MPAAAGPAPERPTVRLRTLAAVFPKASRTGHAGTLREAVMKLVGLKG